MPVSWGRATPGSSGPCRGFNEHTWGNWSSWEFAGNGQDFRFRVCRVCSDTDNAYRTHQHGRPYTVRVSGVKVTRCGMCDATL